MSVFEAVTIAIAFISLSVSISLLLRDRESRRFDLLYRCYERVTDEFNKRPSVSLDKRAEMDESPNDPNHTDIEAQEEDVSFNLEKELNTACFFFLKKQLNANHFYYLFSGWLRSRLISWPKESAHKIHNFRFTWEAIQYYDKKGYFKQKKKP